MPYGSGIGGMFLAGSGANQQPPGAEADYYRLAGNLPRNSVVAVALAWTRRQLMQAKPIVGREIDGEFVAEPELPLQKWLRGRPNKETTWKRVWGATSDAFKVDGNSYWIKARDGYGLVQEIYWVPNARIRIEVSADGSPESYIYTPGRGMNGASGSIGIRYDPTDIVHFRDSVDPENPVMGLSPLKATIRSIAGLNAGETYTAALLRNGTVAWVMVPGKDTGPVMDGSADETSMRADRRKIVHDSSGENTGRLTAVNLPYDFHKVGEPPESMMLDAILDRPESMVLAALGTNANVCQLPSSRDSRTYANQADANKQAWENGIIPMQDDFGEQAFDSLGYEFDLGDEYEIRWDRSKVEALNEQATDRMERSALAFEKCLYPRGKALTLGGFQPLGTPEDELYFGTPTPDAVASEAVSADLQAAAQVEAEPVPGEDGEIAQDEADEAAEAESDAAEGKALPPDAYGPPADVKSLPDVATVLGLDDGELAYLKAADLADLLTPGEYDTAIKSRRNRKKKAKDKGGDPTGKYDEAKHPRGQGGKFARGGGGGKAPKPKQSRHVMLARRAEAATRKHEALQRAGVTGKRYEAALDRAIHLKRQAHAARQARARELAALRKTEAGRESARARHAIDKRAAAVKDKPRAEGESGRRSYERSARRASSDAVERIRRAHIRPDTREHREVREHFGRVRQGLGLTNPDGSRVPRGEVQVPADTPRRPAPAKGSDDERRDRIARHDRLGLLAAREQKAYRKAAREASAAKKKGQKDRQIAAMQRELHHRRRFARLVERRNEVAAEIEAARVEREARGA